MRAVIGAVALILAGAGAASAQTYHNEWVPQSQGHFVNVPGLNLQSANKDQACSGLSPYYENRKVLVNGVYEVLQIVRYVRYENGSTETSQVKCIFLAASANAQQDAIGYLSAVRVYGPDPTTATPTPVGDTSFNPNLGYDPVAYSKAGTVHDAPLCVRGYSYPVKAKVRLGDVVPNTPTPDDYYVTYDGAKGVFDNCQANSQIPGKVADLTACYTNPTAAGCPQELSAGGVQQLSAMLEHRLEMQTETIEQGFQRQYEKLDDLHGTLDQIAIQQRDQTREVQAVNQSVQDGAASVKSAVEAASAEQLQSDADTRSEIVSQGSAVAEAVTQQGAAIKQAVEANTVATNAVRQSVDNLALNSGGGGSGPAPVVDTSAVVAAVNTASSAAAQEADTTRQQIATAATAVNQQAAAEGAATRTVIGAAADQAHADAQGVKEALVGAPGAGGAPSVPAVLPTLGKGAECSASTLYDRKHCGEWTTALDGLKGQIMASNLLRMTAGLVPPAVGDVSTMFALDLRAWGYGIYDVGIDADVMALIRAVTLIGAAFAAFRIVVAA